MAGSVYVFHDEERKLLESLPFALAVYQTVEGRVRTLLVSDGMCRLFHVQRKPLLTALDESMFQYLHPEDVSRIAYAGACFQKGEEGYSVRFRAKFPAMDAYRVFLCDGQKRVMADGTVLGFFIYHDAGLYEEGVSSGNQRFSDFQQKMAYTDPLTGLDTMRYLTAFGMERVRLIEHNGGKAYGVYLNLTGMKVYNRTFGLDAGDQHLIDTARLLERCFPRDTDLVVRCHNDQFMVITSDQDVETTLERMEAEYQSFANAGGSRLVCGVYPIDGSEDSIHQVVDRARFSMRQIDRDLRHVVHFYDIRQDQAYWDEQYVLRMLDAALARKWIKVYYQPIYEVSSGRLVSLEALSRWEDPVKGLLVPSRFIPPLEKYHSVWKLDRFVIGQVTDMLARRIAAGLPLYPVSVNLSPEDLTQKGAVQTLHELTDTKGIPRRLLALEITERALSRDDEHFRYAVSRLREDGYPIWVDDFGSGYSSLNVMNEYRFDLIKLDLGFMRHLDDPEGVNRTIVSTVTEAAHKLHVSVLAEGVETLGQLDFLRGIGCDHSQGFYYAKPGPLSSLEGLL